MSRFNSRGSGFRSGAGGEGGSILDRLGPKANGGNRGRGASQDSIFDRVHIGGGGRGGRGGSPYGSYGSFGSDRSDGGFQPVRGHRFGRGRGRGDNPRGRGGGFTKRYSEPVQLTGPPYVFQVSLDNTDSPSPHDEDFQTFMERKSEFPINSFNFYNDDRGNLCISTDDVNAAEVVQGMNGIRYKTIKTYFKHLSAGGGGGHRGHFTPAPSTRGSFGSYGSERHGESFGFSLGTTNGTSLDDDSDMSAPGIPAGSFIDTLRKILASRYNSQLRFMNLESISSSPELAAMGERDPLDKIGPVLCKLIGNEFSDVETISFANNRIRNLYFLSQLPSYVPGIKNLSFKSNNIRSPRDLDGLDGSRLQSLRELVFQSNPISSQGEQGGSGGYKDQIAQRFPSLEVLDGVEIPKISFGTSIAVGPIGALPVEELGTFVDTDISKRTASGFINRYFPGFDNARSSLLNAYAPTAIFSVTVNSFQPQADSSRGRGRGRGGFHSQGHHASDPYSIQSNFSAWKDVQRNLQDPRQSSKAPDNTEFGNIPVVSTILKLPETRHTFLTGQGGVMVEAWQVPVAGRPLMVINVHGSFNETATGVLRYFDRTFTITALDQPTPDGWQYQILNDQLTLREDSKFGDSGYPQGMDLGAPEPSMGPMTQPAGSNGGQMNAGQVTAQPQMQINQAPQPQPNIPDGMSQEQYQRVMQLCQATGMNPQWSIACLNENEWNADRALVAFQQLQQRNALPPGAFQM